MSLKHESCFWPLLLSHTVRLNAMLNITAFPAVYVISPAAVGLKQSRQLLIDALLQNPYQSLTAAQLDLPPSQSLSVSSSSPNGVGLGLSHVCRVNPSEMLPALQQCIPGLDLAGVPLAEPRLPNVVRGDYVDMYRLVGAALYAVLIAYCLFALGQMLYFRV